MVWNCSASGGRGGSVYWSSVFVKADFLIVKYVSKCDSSFQMWPILLRCDLFPSLTKCDLYFSVWPAFFPSATHLSKCNSVFPSACAAFFPVCRPFPIVPYFSKCTTFFQEWPIFQRVAHYSSCDAFPLCRMFSSLPEFFQVCSTFPNVAHFSKCAAFNQVCRRSVLHFSEGVHFSKCAAFFQGCRTFLSVALFYKFCALIQAWSIFPSVTHFIKWDTFFQVCRLFPRGRILGDCVIRKEPITIEILFRWFRQASACLYVRFIFSSFLFVLAISNLVPHKLSDIGDPQACHLTPSSVTFTSQRALLRITHTKTIQFRERQLEIPLPRIPGSPLCPVTALQHYLASVQLTPSSPLFVCKSHGAYRPILVHQYNAFIKASLTAIGVGPAHYSSHSFRRGGATFAFCREAPTAFIKARGDWKSDAYLIYLTLSTTIKFKILNSITSRLSPPS